MSAWKCEKCGWEGRTTQKSGHMTWRCPKQGNMLKASKRQEREALKKASSYLPCLCGCGEMVGQVKGLRKKHHLNDSHYEAHRALQRSQMGRKARPEEDEQETLPERRLAEEIAPIVALEELTTRAANAVPLVTGEASFRLWAACLGFNSGDVEPVAA